MANEFIEMASKNEASVKPSVNESQTLIPPQTTPPRASEPSRGRKFISVWLPLFIHAALSLAVTLAVALGVDGYNALAYEDQSRTQPEGGYVFRVSDITTLLSAATGLMDYIAELWTGVVGWRCALFLMETRGLKLGHLSDLLEGWPWFKMLELPRGREEWLVGLVLLLLLPQPFIEPLFSGSVDWNSAVDHASGRQIASRDETARSNKWYYYNIQGADRKNSIRRAGGVAAVLWGAIDSEHSKNGSLPTPGGVASRHLMSTIAPVNSTLTNATIPGIHIHNITWSDGSPPEDVGDYAWSDSDDLSTFGDSLFSYVRSGVAVLFSDELWDSPSSVETDRDKGTSTFPKPSRWSGNMTVLLLLGRQTSVSCKPIAGNAFGNSSSLTRNLPGVFYANANAYDENCMVWGTVHFTAGEIHAPESVYVTPQVVEYYPEVARKNTTAPATWDAEIAATIKPSIWTRDALWTMPDAMTQIAVMNTSLLPTWDNLDNYTATLIRYAYMSNWDMLHASFEDTDSATLTLFPAEQRLQASVSYARLFSWYAITLLIPLTGVILKLLHRSSRREMITSKATVLFTDPSGVIDLHPELAGATYITKEQKDMGPILLRPSESTPGRMRLELEESPQGTP